MGKKSKSLLNNQNYPLILVIILQRHYLGIKSALEFIVGSIEESVHQSEAQSAVELLFLNITCMWITVEIGLLCLYTLERCVPLHSGKCPILWEKI